MINVHVAFVFGLQTLKLVDFTKFFQLNGLKPKNKGQTKSYERFDLTKKCVLYVKLIHNSEITEIVLFGNTDPLCSISSERTGE